MIGTSVKGWVGATIAALAALAMPVAASAFDPELEVKDFAKIGERVVHITATPEFQLRLQEANVANASRPRRSS